MSLVIANKQIDIPGLEIHSWLDAALPWIKEITDFSPRTLATRLIMGHTHKGIAGKVLPGSGTGTSTAKALVRYQTNTDRKVSWDYTCDNNGVIYCQNDPTKKASWQAGSVNGISLGFEMIQADNGDLYEVQIEKMVLLIDALTSLLGIQRQIPWDKKGNRPKKSVCPRLQAGGRDVTGFAGHRNQTVDRGPGDPGDAIYLALQKAGYECFELNDNEDLQVWKGRQKTLGFTDAQCDGVPGAKTVAALKATGYKHGIYVRRPIDDLIQL